MTRPSQPLPPRVQLCIGRKQYGKTSLAIDLVTAAGRCLIDTHTLWIVNPTCDHRLRSTRRSIDGIDALRRSIVLIDELRLFQHPGSMPDPLRRFLLDIWHRDNYLVGTTRRLADLHQDLVAAADRLYVFQVVAHRDLEALGRYTDRETVERAGRLGPYQYLGILL